MPGAPKAEIRNRERQRVREERDAWLLTVIAESALQKASYRVASFIALKLNIDRADFRWGESSIAGELNIDARTARRAIGELKQEGYVLACGRHRSRGTRIYRISHPTSTGQPCPVEPVTLDRVLEHTRQVESTGQPCPVDGRTANDPIDDHGARPDRNEPSTGQNPSLDRTALPPKPMEPCEPTAEGGCASKAQQPPSAGRANRNAEGEEATASETKTGAPQDTDLKNKLKKAKMTARDGESETQGHQETPESRELRRKAANKILEDAGFTEARFAENDRQKAQRKRNQTVDWLH